jgi:hypothetical protein
MRGHRTVIWTLGSGASRLSCGVGRTGEGFVVDLRRGDECLKTELFATREAAVRRALALETANDAAHARGVRRR